MDKNHWPLGKIRKNRHISSTLSEGPSHKDQVDNHPGVWVSFSIQQMESRTASIFYLFTCPDGGCKRRNYPNSVWLKQMWRNNDSWNRFCPSRDGDPGAWRSEGADYMFSKDILTDHWRMPSIIAQNLTNFKLHNLFKPRILRSDSKVLNLTSHSRRGVLGSVMEAAKISGS